MRHSNLVFIVILGLFLTACQTTNHQPLPVWVSNPQISNEAFYAIGEGVSLKEAQANAKQELAAQLLSHVSSELNVLAIQDADFNREYVEKRTQAHFNKVALPAVKIRKQQKVGNSFFAQAVLNKNTLKPYLSDSLDQQLKQIKALLNEAKQQPNAFDRWWFLNQHQTDIDHFADQSLIYNSLFLPKKKENTTLIQAFFRLETKARQSLKLKIKDNTPIKGLEAETESQLAKYKVAIDDSWFNKSSTLSFRVASDSSKLQGEYYCLSKLTITLTSQQGQTLATYSISERGVSVSSSSKAKQSSYRKLLKQLKKTDILETLKNS